MHSMIIFVLEEGREKSILLQKKKKKHRKANQKTLKLITDLPWFTVGLHLNMATHSNTFA